MDDFVYGSLSYKRRFSIKLSLDSYEPTILTHVISTSIRLYYTNVGCTHLCYECQILYRDDSFKVQLLKLDLHDYEISILSIGDSKMSF